MNARLKGWMIVVLVSNMMAPAGAEEITLTTYYPSPRGVVKEQQVTSHAELAYEGDDPKTPELEFVDPKLRVWIGRVAPEPPDANATRLNVFGGIRAGGMTFLDYEGSGDNYLFGNTYFGSSNEQPAGIWRADGAVGIGTTSPPLKLTVEGGPTAAIAFRQFETSAEGEPLLRGILYATDSDDVGFDEEMVLTFQGSSADDQSRIFIGPNSTTGGVGLIELDAKTVFVDKANVGIGTPTPTSPAPGPGGTPTTGNLDVNDVFVRAANGGAGRWMSQNSQVTYIDRVSSGVGSLGYPDAIPTTASNIIVTFHVTTQSSRDCFLLASADNVGERVAAHSFSPNNSDDAASDMNTMILPYSRSRRLNTRTSGSCWYQEVSFDGYM